MWTKSRSLKGSAMEVLVFPKMRKSVTNGKVHEKSFSFAGVPKPERALLQQPLLDESKIYLFLKF